MADIPIINPPDKEHLEFCWQHQFTIPLLFDDCLSLLQKVCALWAKLNDVIDSLNEFNDQFNIGALSILSTYGLESKLLTPNFKALKEFMDVRFNISVDDYTDNNLLQDISYLIE